MAPLLLLLAPVVSDRGIVYSHAGGESLEMDIHRPATVEGALPCVVVIHGGSWIGGKREDMDALAKALAEKGLVAANITYRLAKAPQFHRWPAMLDDAQTAVRFLRANAAKYHVDPMRMGSAGASAGGHLALFLGCRDTRDPDPKEYPEVSSRVSAVLDLFGPTDMTQDYPRNVAIDFLYQTVLGKPRDKAEAEIRDASPLLFIDKRSAPVFIVQGLVDPLVNPHQSQMLEAKLKEMGIGVEARYVEGMGHGGDPNDPKIGEAYAAGIDWIAKELLASRRKAA
ncbi:MAG: alpha/beta hydrolase [Fimbriimonadaceae bacterium]|nr:alpha/beta hydrolase [Fimbriimonadaceae bacterium]